MALLGKMPLGELAELSQFNVLPTRELCAAYGNALSTLANRIAETQGDHLAAAIDLEWQMPNLKWLITAKCDLNGPLNGPRSISAPSPILRGSPTWLTPSPKSARPSPDSCLPPSAGEGGA